jgi:hypothetical protein
MTAIAIAYTTSGIVIAADGRSFSRDPATGEVVVHRDTEQKIFVTRFKEHDIAYALTGGVYSDDMNFNLITESEKAFRSITTAPNGDEFTGAFARKIKDVIVDARNTGLISAFEQNLHLPENQRNLIARIYLAGWFRKEKSPSLVIIEFNHENEVVTEPRRISATPPEQNMYDGTSSLAPLMFGGDPRFAKYLRPLNRNNSIQEAAEHVKGYIEACCDPIARDIDPLCKGIGGHIHIAAVTPARFSWIVGPSEQKRG